MTGRAWLPEAAALVLLVAAACGPGEEEGAAGDEIRIGVVLSVTGTASSLGEAERNTIRLFEEEFSTIAGQPVRWIVEDDATDPTRAVTEVKTLVDQQQVHAVVCCTVSPNSMAILETVQGSEVPNISLAAAATIVEPVEERRWVFKTPQNDELMVDLATDDMLANDVRSVAFLGFDDAYGESGRIEFEEVAQAKGIEVTGAETFAREDTDVSAQLTRLARGNPDAYLIWAIPPGAVVAQKNLTDLGLEGVVYQSHGVANRTFLELGGSAVEETLLPAGKLLVADQLPDEDSQKQTLLDYQETYEGEFGEGTANTFGGHAYDAMLVLRGAIERAVDRGADPSDVQGFRSALRDAIEETTNLVGISGIFNYSAQDHHGLDRRAVVMVLVENNDWSLIPESLTQG